MRKNSGPILLCRIPLCILWQFIFRSFFHPLLTYFLSILPSRSIQELCLFYAAWVWRDPLTPFNHNLFILEWQGILSLVTYEDPLQDSNGLILCSKKPGTYEFSWKSSFSFTVFSTDFLKALHHHLRKHQN